MASRPNDLFSYYNRLPRTRPLFRTAHRSGFTSGDLWTGVWQ
jgi:hypothetical protein